MHYSVGHRYKGQTEVATFWCCLVFQQLHMQFWSKRASSCICWTQQRRRRRTVVEKRRKKDQIWKKYFKILKDIDHYNSWLLMLVMVLHEKNTLHSEPKCIFSGQNFSIKLLKILNEIRGVFWNMIGDKMRVIH